MACGPAKLEQVTDMVSNEPLAQTPISAAYHAAPAIAFDDGFDARWTAWIARGRVHERLVRRRLVVLAGAVAMGAAIVYAFVR
jgi:hypothetical protein